MLSVYDYDSGFIRHFNNGLNLCFYIQRQPSSFVVQEEDDDDPTFTQPSTSQVQRGMDKLSATQVDQKVTTTQKSTQKVIVNHPKCALT